MADIIKAISANDIRHGTSVTGVDGTGNVQAYFETGKDATSPALSDIESKYVSRFDDPTYYFHHGLVDGLEFYYRLDEQSGTRLDSLNGKHLTDNNTVGYVAGVSSKVGDAANFTRGNLEYLSLDNASLDLLSPGDTNWSMACWIKLDSSNFSDNQHIFGVWRTSPSSHREYLLYWKAGHTKLWFYTSNNGSSTSYIPSAASLSANTWYHVMICHDATNDQRLMYIDGALSNSDSYSTGVYQGSGDFNIGRTNNSTDYVDGAVDEFGMWSRVLTAAEAVSLYNNGNGRKVR